MERETLINIVYDVLKDFQGGRVTDDSKVSEAFVENKVHDARNRAIYRYYTSQKVRKKDLPPQWFQDFEATYDPDIQEDGDCPYTIFKIPKLLDMPDNSSAGYVGASSLLEPIPVEKNAGRLNSFLTHRTTKHDTMAVTLGNELRIYNLFNPETVFLSAIFERPTEVPIFGKGYSENKKQLEMDKFRRNEYYPISGTLINEVKQRAKKEAQMAFGTPVDRFVDDRQTTDYGAEQEES